MEAVSPPKKFTKREGTSMKKRTKTNRAELKFSVGRVDRLLRKNCAGKCRVALAAPIYLAAVLEYITAEVLELAGDLAIKDRKHRITPRHLQLAIRDDNDLSELLGSAVIASGGVLPNIHPILLPPKSKRTTKSSSSSGSGVK
jgi:histone H2A